VTRSLEEIVAIARNRMSDQGPLFEAMRQVLFHYEGDYVIPFNTDAQDVLPPMTPMLVADSIDHQGMSAASVMPMIGVPALDASVQHGARSRDYASIRRTALKGTWDRSELQWQLRRWFRQYAAYRTASFLVCPDHKYGFPQIEMRTALATFPEPKAPEDVTPVEDCVYITRRSGEFLRYRFPQVRAEHGGPISGMAVTELWDVLEYHDCDEIVVALMGPVTVTGTHVAQPWVGHAQMELAPRRPNRAGICLAVPVRAASLEGMVSQLRNSLGQVEYAAKLEGLNLLAAEKNIFPDIYALGARQGSPSIVGGAWQDGRSGNINLLVDVEQVGTLRTQPDPSIQATIDRRERNFRISNSLPPQAGGETYGALRTGRAIDSLYGIAVDTTIQEMHEAAEMSLRLVNQRVLAAYRGWFGAKTYYLSSGSTSQADIVEFTPNTHVERTGERSYDGREGLTLHNSVKYAIAGADVQQTTVWLSQLLGVKGISLRTFRDKHPHIDNPEEEAARVDEEDFEQALKEAIMRQVVQGTMPITFAAKIEEYRRQGLDIFEAVQKADEDLRQQQATLPPETPAGMGAPPATMPGLAAGPAGVTPMVPSGIGPEPGTEDLSRLMYALRQTA
jgi:hypothetical protein